MRRIGPGVALKTCQAVDLTKRRAGWSVYQPGQFAYVLRVTAVLPRAISAPSPEQTARFGLIRMAARHMSFRHTRRLAIAVGLDTDASLAATGSN